MKNNTKITCGEWDMKDEIGTATSGSLIAAVFLLAMLVW